VVNIVLTYLGAYLLGAIPFGLLIARLRGVDIMAVGSKNIGATNVWRTLGPLYGFIAMILDMAKGFVPALIAHQVLGTQEHAFFAGMTAVVGHSLSPFLGFKGGKGVATTAGAMIGAIPVVALPVMMVFISFLIITRYVSLSSIFAAASLPVFSFLFKDPPIISAFLVLVAGFIIYKHKANISRLRDGTESKFRFDGKKSEPAPSAEPSDDEKDQPE